MMMKKGAMTQEFYNFTTNNLKEYSYSTGSSYKNPSEKIIHDDYLPFYSIRFCPTASLPIDFKTGKVVEDQFDLLYGGRGWRSNKEYTERISKFYADKEYTLLLCSDPALDCSSNDTLYRTIINRTDISFDFPIDIISSTMSVGLEPMFNNVKMLNRWAFSRLRGKNTLTHISNMYFLGIADLSDRKIKVSPLFSLMVKKENIRLVRAMFYFNIPIPSSLMELWIDNSLEEQGSKLKPTFRKYIKNNLVNAGVVVKYFNSLKEEIVRTEGVPPFYTLQEQTDWSQGVLQEFYEYENKRIMFGNSLANLPYDPRVTALREEFRLQYFTVVEKDRVVLEGQLF